jgi:myo-inositol-1(or 4)-monophosphatase
MSVRRSPHLNVMVDTAEKAGRTLLRDFGEVEQLQVSKKGPGDFVSTADHKAERLIRELLEKARPSYGFLLEETGEIKGQDGEHRFIVDPLDGTTNFLHGLPHWCVSIALERNGEVIAGVVHDPVKNETFWAEKGLGSMLNNRRIQVSARKNLTDALISTAFTPALRAGIDNLEKQGAVIRSYGSACLDLCYVAAGRFDDYFEDQLTEWVKAVA